MGEFLDASPSVAPSSITTMQFRTMSGVAAFVSGGPRNDASVFVVLGLMDWRRCKALPNEPGFVAASLVTDSSDV